MQTNKAVPSEGKAVYYRSDGTGRDTYIRNHNGGLLSHDRIHQLKQYRPPRQKAFTFAHNKYGKHPYEYNKGAPNKFVHYISDGSGRDFYVGSTEGGNSNPFHWRNQTDFYFRQTLRQNKKLPTQNPEKPDVFMSSQAKFMGTQQKFHKTMSSMQDSHVRKLSQHKKSPPLPAIDTYYAKGFDTTREFRKKDYGINN